MPNMVYVIFVKIGFCGDNSEIVHRIFSDEESAKQCVNDLKVNYSTYYYDVYYNSYPLESTF